MGDADADAFTRQLGVSENEFFSSLPAAIGHRDYVREGRRIRIDVDGGAVTLELGPQETRRLGSLELPYLQVSFRFSGLTPEARAHFMERFELYFRRGGG